MDDFANTFKEHFRTGEQMVSSGPPRRWERR